MPAPDRSVLLDGLSGARRAAHEHPVLTDIALSVLIALVLQALLGGSANVFLVLLVLGLASAVILALRRRFARSAARSARARRDRTRPRRAGAVPARQLR